MLRNIRGKLNSFFALLIMGLLIAAFALWGIGDIFRTTSANVVAEVGDTEITSNAFQNELQRELRTIQAQVGEAIDPQQSLQLGIPQRVLQQLIQRASFDEEARVLGLRASDEQVARTIREMEAFQGLDGSFNMETYQLQLRNAGYTVTSFEALIRQDLARQQLIESVAQTPPIPGPMQDAILSYREETRAATLVTVPASAVEDVQEPTEQELRGAYESSPDAYMRPQYRAINYIWITPQDMLDLASVTEEEVRDEFEFRIGEYESPELRNLKLVTFDPSDEDRAREFYRRTTAGEKFEEVATEMTDFTAEELLLGDMARRDLTEEYNERVAEAVFTVDDGEVTQPAASIFGWHVFKVEGITEEASRSFEQVAPGLRREIALRRAEDALFDLSQRIDDELAAGAMVRDVGETLGLEVHSQVVSQQGLTPQGGLAQPIPPSQVLSLAFRTEIGQEPILEETDDGAIYMIDVEDIIAPERRPFEEVREQVRQNWIAQQQRLVAAERATEAADRLRAGEDPSEIAADYGGLVLRRESAKRRSANTDDSLAPQIVDLIFSTPQGNVEIERAATGDGYIVARVERVIEGTRAAGIAAREVIRQQLAAELTNDLVAIYQFSLRDNFGVDINQQLINQIVDPAANL